MQLLVKVIVFKVLFLFLATVGKAQTIAKIENIAPDSLRGTLYPWRAAIDVKQYQINLSVFPDRKSIRGFVEISFEVVKPTQLLQWDLDTALTITGFSSSNPIIHQAQIKRRGSFLFQQTAIELEKGFYSLIIHYEGKPKESNKPPWDGGFVWKADKSGIPWVGLAVEGEGASLWFPCKDHLFDKAKFSVTCQVPKPLVFIGNGNRTSFSETDSTTIAIWETKAEAPIYSISLNLGNYQHISDSMQGINGNLKLDYYVLPENFEKAKSYFSKEVKPMIAAFEKRIAPYPFYADGYALIQTPYWGMEHQSGIAYGNNFVKNEVDMDFIIVHESAHEWWGNSVSCADRANMFIQEGYCTYSEFTYLEETKGPKALDIWLKHHQKQILNKQPIKGPEGINYQDTDTDIYYKYALVLYTIRQLIGDTKFNIYIRSFYKEGYNKAITYIEFNKLNTKLLGKKYAKLIEWYITHTQYPTVQYTTTDKGVYIRWAVKNIPSIRVPMLLNNERINITPSTQWQKLAPSSVKSDLKIANPYLLLNLENIKAN